MIRLKSLPLPARPASLTPDSSDKAAIVALTIAHVCYELLFHSARTNVFVESPTKCAYALLRFSWPLY